MTNLNVSMPEAMKDYIEREVSRGGYSTPSEFVRELVRDFQRRKAADNEGRLVEALLSGEAVVDDPALEALHRKLRARIDKRLLAASKTAALDGEEVLGELRKSSRARLKRERAS
jgi:antitoxin ParD1/3/4